MAVDAATVRRIGRLARIRVEENEVEKYQGEINAILEDESVYRRLGRWGSMLGFRGHFSTKSRNYSTTLGRLRSARRAWSRLTAAQRAAAVAAGESSEDADTTLVVGTWAFVGMGWQTSGDATLARHAAAAAREWRDARAQGRPKTRKD